LPKPAGVNGIADGDVGVNEQVLHGVEAHPRPDGVMDSGGSIFVFLAPPVAAKDYTEKNQDSCGQIANPGFLDRSHGNGITTR
jgi:hypothetical protein